MKATPLEIEQAIEAITEQLAELSPRDKRYDTMIRERNQLHLDLYQAQHPVHLQREPLQSKSSNLVK